MRIPEEYKEIAEREGLPMFRIQIDWRYVPKDKRSLKSYELCGYTTIENAASLFRLSCHDLSIEVSNQPEQP